MKRQMISLIFLILLSQMSTAGADSPNCFDVVPSVQPGQIPTAFEQYCDCEKSRPNTNPSHLGDDRRTVRGQLCGNWADGNGEVCEYPNGAKQNLCCDPDYEECCTDDGKGSKAQGLCCEKPGKNDPPNDCGPTYKCVNGTPVLASKKLVCHQLQGCCGNLVLTNENKFGCCYDPANSGYLEYADQKTGIPTAAESKDCCEKTLDVNQKAGQASACDECVEDPPGSGTYGVKSTCKKEKCEICDENAKVCKPQCIGCQVCDVNTSICNDPECEANEKLDENHCCVCKNSCSKDKPCQGNQTCSAEENGCCECPNDATVCESSSECGEGEQCIDGCCKGCEDGSTPCLSDSDCSGSEECKENCCAPKETCEEDDDCGSCETCKKEEGSDTGTCEALECDEEKCEKCEDGHECKPDPECCFPECSDDEQCCGGTCVPKCCTTCEYNEETGQWESETDENCCCNGDVYCDDNTGECDAGDGGEPLHEGWH